MERSTSTSFRTPQTSINFIGHVANDFTNRNNCLPMDNYICRLFHGIFVEAIYRSAVFVRGMHFSQLDWIDGPTQLTFSASSSSCALNFSASWTMRSISSGESLPSLALISAPAFAPVTMS